MLGRFAPSITGFAHPGTLLSALLAWLDVRSQGGRFILRLEDLDQTRIRPGYIEKMYEALEWIGIDWDLCVKQSELREQHEEALEKLISMGQIYSCSCSRREIRESGQPAADGGFRYSGRCRERGISPNWRNENLALRLKLPATEISLHDEGGLDLSQTPLSAMGDPILRRRDGAMAYQLVAVVDDVAAGVTRVIRGRDLSASCATQVLIHRILGLSEPVYRHHFLLMEKREQKLAKFHGSIPFSELVQTYSGQEFCGVLAAISGLIDRPMPCTPAELAKSFSWEKVRKEDYLWTGEP